MVANVFTQSQKHQHCNYCYTPYSTMISHQIGVAQLPAPHSGMLLARTPGAQGYWRAAGWNVFLNDIYCTVLIILHK
jgi:hypothetical protein